MLRHLAYLVWELPPFGRCDFRVGIWLIWFGNYLPSVGDSLMGVPTNKNNCAIAAIAFLFENAFRSNA